MHYVRFLLFYFCWSGISACAATMPAIQMKFVDAQTNQPVAGAHVFFQASAREGTFTGHGGQRVNLFLVEAITNDAGEMQLAAQNFWPHPFLLDTNFTNPSMIVFKPGYALLTLQNNRRILAELQDVTTWENNNQTIRMRPANSNKDIYHSVYWTATFAAETYQADMDICSWKKIPRLLVVVDREINQWNRERHWVEEKDLRQINSPLRGLLGNERYYTEKGCGSPKAFFDAYMRDTNP